MNTHKKTYENIRGYMVKLYPTPEQVVALREIQRSSRLIWNDMVRQSTDAWEARKAYAIRSGVVRPPPPPPEYEGMTPEKAKAAKSSFLAERRAWTREMTVATKDMPECAPRKFAEVLTHFGDKFDYQYFNRFLRGIDAKPLPAAIAQALAKSLFQVSGRPKRRRKRDEDMPVRTRSGDCVRFGEFGKRRDNEEFYDVLVSLPGGVKIRGRSRGDRPDGHILQGVALREQADGWWAALKYEAKPREIPEPIPESIIGVDAGLVNLAAFSDGRTVENNRAKEYAERIAGRQAFASTIEDPDARRAYTRTTARMQLRAARQTLHVIYNKVVKAMAKYATIVVELLPPNIGQRGSDMTSAMRKMVALLRERYGDRVREVDPSYTSQDCSRCQKRCKESWSYEHGRIGECTQCGYRADRDVNAARNLVRKYTESLPPLAA